MISPFRSNKKLTVTQEYGNTTNNNWYRTNGIDIPFHNGVDIVFGTPKETFGTECVCPKGNWKVVKLTWESPNSTKGNGVTIQSEENNGVIYQVVYWHTSEIIIKLGQNLKEGDVICYIGNSGLCNPKPTSDKPFNGSHCHLMLFEYRKVTTPQGTEWKLQNSNNGVSGSIDPRNLFDFYNWYKVDLDTGLEHDIWALLPFAKLQKDVVGWFKKIGLL
jgi:murein DD-endopeptidase MepM/ murein hydrolase activator NlpD